MSNPYAPPQAAVQDVIDPAAGLVLADRGTRLGAAMLDGLIMMAMIYLPTIVSILIAAPAGAQGGDAADRIVIAGMALSGLGFVIWAWLTITYVMANGQSMAKKMLRIKVVRSDGSPVSLSRVFWLRNVVNGILSIIPLYGLIEVLFIFGDSRQCLHDKLADTIVVLA
jgi:uncharacterized RDD family membrane protein YckC